MHNGVMDFNMASLIAIVGFGSSIIGGLYYLGWTLRGVSDKIDQVATKQTEQQATVEKHEAALNEHNIKFAQLERKCPLLTPTHNQN